MNEEYDVIVLGTGMKECILSGILAKFDSKKILQIDRNNYYGADSASLNLTNLWKMFRAGQEVPKNYGENRDWNVDLIPKFVMANGNLVKILIRTNVSQYLEWKCVDGTFVYQWDKGGLFSNAKGVIHKVPANDKEALKSDLMGLFEKNRCRKFFQFIQDWKPEDGKTHKKFQKNTKFSEVVKEFSLETNTTDFIGHAVALYTNDDFLNEPYFETVHKIQLYMSSIDRYGPSPFIYPIWGLSGIAEGFSRYNSNYNSDCALYMEEHICSTETVRRSSSMNKENSLVSSPKERYNRINC
jgi:Rab GDP dissociation inhibitor